MMNSSVQRSHFNRGISALFGMMLGPLIAVSLFLLFNTALHRDSITGSFYGYIAVLAFGGVGSSFLIWFTVRARLATPAIELHPDFIVASAFLFDRKVVRWDEVKLIKDISRPSGNWNNGRVRSFEIIGNGHAINFNEYYTHYPELLALINEQIVKHHIQVLVQRYPPLNTPAPRLPSEKSVDRLELDVR